MRDIIEKYRMLYDFHTHTTYSRGIFGNHAKGTIEGNVETAVSKGLEAVAISEHGPGHIFYGLDQKLLPEMRAEIKRVGEKYPQIKIYLSVEANIGMSENYIDVRPEDAAKYDFLLAGYHYGITKGQCVGNWMNARNMKSKSGKAKLLEKNTEMMVGALYNNDIKILTHPGDKGPFDMEAVAKACEDTDTLMEISTWHKNLTVEDIKICAKYDVSFIVSSDAHTSDRVGTFEGGLERALLAGLDPERIVNIGLK